MHLPDRVKDIRRRYVARFPVPQGSPGDAFEESARQWSIRFAEQVAFEVGPMWGMKRADPGRPISKDTIALSQDGRLLIWDLLTGTGTGSPRLVDDPDSEDVTGQTFVPVTPTDHLGTGEPVPDPPADTSALELLLTEQRATRAEVAALGQAFSGIDQTLRSLESSFNALQLPMQQLAVAQEAIRDSLTLLVDRPVKIPDGKLRVAGRVVGDLDFPNG